MRMGGDTGMKRVGFGGDIAIAVGVIDAIAIIVGQGSDGGFGR